MTFDNRYLAQHWEDTYPPNNLQTRRYDPIPTYLDSIDHFVLLDLLGNSHSRIHSYYRETDWLHGQMADADKRLRAAGLVEVEQGEEAWFQMQKMPPGMIGDDHVPVGQDCRTVETTTCRLTADGSSSREACRSCM